MEIRIAKAEDAAEGAVVLRRYIRVLSVEDHGNNPHHLAGWLANKTPEAWCVWCSDPGSNLFVAMVTDQIAGVALLTDAGGVALNYVAPEYRFQGVSKALMAHMETAARAAGHCKITLTSTRTAERFYVACGYRATRRDIRGHLQMEKPLM